MESSSSTVLRLDGEALKAWEGSNVNDENIQNARAESIAQKTLAEVKAQLETSSKALKKSKLLITTLRAEKTKLKAEVVEVRSANSSLVASLESTKSDALAISNSLSQVQGVVNKSRNDKDIATIQYKDSKRKLEETRELLVREKDSNAIMRHDMRELKAKLEEVEERARSGEHALEALTEKTAPAARLAQDLSVKNREISGSMAAIESELRTVRNESAGLRQELLVKTETAAVLSAQLSAIQKKGTVVSHNDMERYRLLETQLAKVTSRYEDLERSLDAHNELLASEGRKANKLRTDMAALVTKEDDYKSVISR
jgi:chromosome segregation ATPase